MRNPSCKPCTAATGDNRPHPGEPDAWSSSTAAAAPWPTSPPTTSTSAQVLGQIAPKTGIEPFEKLVAHVMTTEPYASARRVFWVVDNGSSHNGARSIERMQTAWPTATLVHLPIHASWLNQVEIYFSILQRKAISPNDFTDLDQLSERIIGFQDRYNTTATPFDWTYTRDDLNAFLNRLDLNDAHIPTPHDPRRTYDRDH